MTKRRDHADIEQPEWRIVSRRQVFDGNPWIEVWTEDVVLPDGRRVDSFYRLEMPDYVVIVPFVAGEVAVQRHYKHGPRRVGLHLPAGHVEAEETPLVAAKRELLEETGLAADRWLSLGRLVVDGNRGAGTAHIFLADGATPHQPPDSDDLEATELSFMTLESLVRAARDGDVPLLAMVAAIGLAFIEQMGRR
jgi:ADP-ribose pyrophosphatase